MPSCRGSSWPRDLDHVSCGSCIAGRFFTAGPPGKPQNLYDIRHKCGYKNAHLLICGHKVSFWKLLYEDIEDLVVKWWTSNNYFKLQPGDVRRTLSKRRDSPDTNCLRSQNSSHEAARQILLSLHQHHSTVCCVSQLIPKSGSKY